MLPRSRAPRFLLFVRRAPGIVLGLPAGFRDGGIEDERPRPLRVGRREDDREGAAVALCEYHGLLAAGCVQDRPGVVHSAFERWQLVIRDTIREPGSTPVEDDETEGGCQPAEEPRDRGLLPVQVEMGDPAGDVQQIEGAVAQDLVGDVDGAASRVAHLGGIHERQVSAPIRSMARRHALKPAGGGRGEPWRLRGGVIQVS